MGDAQSAECSETTAGHVLEIERINAGGLHVTSKYHTGRSLSEDYEVENHVLGRGISGAVHLGQHRANGRRCAIKSQECRNMDTKQLEFLKAEIEVYLSLDHPNVARLYDVYENAGRIDMVMEYCRGGELLKRLKNKKCYSEWEAAEASCQMFLAVSYIHAHGIAHRDIKPENFLYETDDEDSSLKLIDFGIAKNCDKGELMVATCGSPLYMSPDVLSGSYTTQCDCWSLGVIVFMLLSGYPPFLGSNTKDTLNRVRDGSATMIEEKWKPISKQGRDFVAKLLNRNPDVRMTAHAALDHPWLREHQNLSDEPCLHSSSLSAMQRFADASRLRRALLQLVAQELPQSELEQFRGVFLQLDKGHTGTVTLNELKSAINQCSSFTLHRSTSSLLDVLDENHNGEVDFTEFVAATAMTPTGKGLGSIAWEKAAEAAFHRFDVHHLGKITSSDLSLLLGGGSLDELCNENSEEKEFLHDADSRGGLTFEEFSSLIRGENTLDDIRDLIQVY